ncbi:MAG: cytochrome b [Chromatiales bacterium]|nr:cytochrome b [Chromatiales bacterium]
MLRNDRERWGAVARGLHWSIALIVAVQIPLGFWMNQVYRQALAGEADFALLLDISLVHHTLGFVMLALVAVRLGWRFSNPAPDLPAALVAWQRWTARLTQGFLYLLLIIFPLSGWAALSAYSGEFPIYFFGWDRVPRLVPQTEPEVLWSYEFFAWFHRMGWRIGALLLGLHVAGALWHHFVRRDRVAMRMIRGA